MTHFTAGITWDSNQRPSKAGQQLSLGVFIAFFWAFKKVVLPN